MATLNILPATTYRPGQNGQVPMVSRSLNTIMEEEESNRGSFIELYRGRDRSPQKANWLSPLSDHFPTPRGNHFMSAPIPQSDPEDSDDGSASPATSSQQWTRNSYSTDATDFDDLYDASSDEETKSRSTVGRRKSTRNSITNTPPKVTAKIGRASRTALPALSIPRGGDPWPGVEAFKLMTSPIPPTPPPKVPMSPAILSYLQSQEVPSSSAPPSLDGSLTSEQLAQISAPPTPDVGNSDDEGDHWGSGVQLQPAAMATLQALSGGDDFYEHAGEQVIEIPEITPEVSPARIEMQQSLPPLITQIHRNNSLVLSPEQQVSMDSLTRLEIPSPGGFFSALSRGARHTWHLVPCTPESAHPPSSTTAEHFYKTPWSSAPVERIVEIPEATETMSDGIPTARPSLAQLNAMSRPELPREDSDETITAPAPVASSPVEEVIVPDEILEDQDNNYIHKVNQTALANFNRTSLWLQAQCSYLAEVLNPPEERDDEVALLKRASTVKSQKSDKGESDAIARKTVRFSEISAIAKIENVVMPLPSTARLESAYYRAFVNYMARSRYRDTFVHRIPRFEAMQAQRVSLTHLHRAQLLGKFQLSVVPMSAKRRMSANVARGDDMPIEDPEKIKRDREHEAFQQMKAATWNVQAIKLLNGGRLIAAPVAKRLARLSSMGPKLDGKPRDRARILDLGGQATCDWAWHCASEYPNAKVYTVTTKALRQLSNSNIRGPKNHRNVAVPRLTKLPFKDNQFDIVSAREIYTILKQHTAQDGDEWEACLKECHRVLKPGGYLEFSIMDSEIVNAGPLGLAKSVEFGFNLKTLGYDPSPTKSFLSRLRSTGFVGMKRAWVFLPMGAKIGNQVEARDSMGVERKLELEAIVSGSTENAASICGVVGAWAWEKWLMRCKVQTVGEEAKLEDVVDVIEEGRACGAGWRTLNGWARKPL